MLKLLSHPLLRSHDRRPPAAYLVTAAVASLVVLVSFATARWVPWFVEQMAWTWPSVAGSGYLTTGPVWLLMGTTFGLVAVSAPWLAFRWPALAYAVALLPSLVTWMDGNVDLKSLPFGAIAVLGAVALTASWRRPVWSVVCVVTAIVVSWVWVTSGVRMTAPFGADVTIEPDRAAGVGTVYTVGLLLVLGIAVLLRRGAFREEQRRALAARSGEVEAEAATVAERARLARDLHDVVAHHVSLIAVRAETAPYTEPELGEAGRRVLTDIASDARLALDELRGVLGILGRAGGVERSPQPSWSDIPALVERSRTAGADVILEGDAGAVTSPATGYAAYRIVQEALTNARKHAPGQAVGVRLEGTGQLVVVQVHNRVPAGGEAGQGHGLVGMRERVEALGGRLTAEQRGEDFVIEATLPQGAVA